VHFLSLSSFLSFFMFLAKESYCNSSYLKLSLFVNLQKCMKTGEIILAFFLRIWKNKQIFNILLDESEDLEPSALQNVLLTNKNECSKGIVKCLHYACSRSWIYNTECITNLGPLHTWYIFCIKLQYCDKKTLWFRVKIHKTS